MCLCFYNLALATLEFFFIMVSVSKVIYIYIFPVENYNPFYHMIPIITLWRSGEA